MRRYLNLAALAGIIALITFAYCTGKSQGVANGEDKAAKRAAASLQRAGNEWKRIADKERDSRLQQEKKLKQADSLLKVRGVSLIKATQKYEVLRDSVLKAPHSNVESDIIAAADSALGAAHLKDSAQSAKIVLLEADTASKAREIFALRNVVSTREGELRALNRRLAISSKRIRNARREGWIQGIGAAAFGIVVLKASQ